jgi:uncharacterized protein YggE
MKLRAEGQGMKRASLLVSMILLTGSGICRGQVGGNSAYAQIGGKARAEQEEQNKRKLGDREVPPTGTSMFVEASVLMNVKADEYIAVFGVVEEGESVAECGRKMDATIREFTETLKPMGVSGDGRFVDFVAQNRIYAFEVTNDIAREKLVGFELKKNVAIHYKDRDLLDKLVVAAAKSKIYDLIKVDYIVKDRKKIQARLMEEAARVIKEKSARYESLLGIKLQPPGQVYAERSSIHYPTAMYDAYNAFEAEAMSGAPRRQNDTVQGARKSRTFYYNGLDGDGFDDVINPVVVEPAVQFTLYLKVKYDVEPIKAK